MFEVVFLLILGFVYVVFASVSDLKTHEVPNWLNYSLIVFALGFRLFYSLFNLGDLGFFVDGLVGLGIFFVLGNLFYHSRIFAGGDAKLMIALGPVLPIEYSFFGFLQVLDFILIFFTVGAVYGVLWSFFLVLKNKKRFKKEFGKIFSKNKLSLLVSSFIGVLMSICGLFLSNNLLFFGLFVFVLPLFYLYAKAVDESCMVSEVSVSDLTEGDWLYQSVKVGKNEVKKSWEGLSSEEIRILKKHLKKVFIKNGIPFVPVFLFSYLIWIYFLMNNLSLLYLF